MFDRDPGGIASDLVNWRKTFIAKHGGPNAAIAYGTFFLFPDGASIERTSAGSTFDPPEDAVERQKLIIKYRELQVRRHEDMFAERKRRHLIQFHGERNTGVMIDLTITEEQDLRELIGLMEAAKDWRRQLEQAQQQLAKLTSHYTSPTEERLDALYAAEQREIREAARKKVVDLRL